MAGITTSAPFPTYPDGFPPEVIDAFAAIAGSEPLGNVPASGTEIIAQLGEEHMRTGRPIVYTSADSVFQVAAHEDIVPLARLYDWCERARAMLVPPHEVNRVIARPFVGEPGVFVRTANRRDYAIPPPSNALDTLAAAGIAVHGIGKISDIYNGRGLATSVRVADNEGGDDQDGRGARRRRKRDGIHEPERFRFEVRSSPRPARLWRGAGAFPTCASARCWGACARTTCS